MKLLINSQRSINEITENFAKRFPFLRVGFFYDSHLPGQTLLQEEEIQGTTSVGKIINMKEPVVIDIDRSTSVASLAKQVVDKTGLGIKVFRRQNKKWVEIKRMKESLERLNSIGLANQYNSFNYHTLFL